jgi:hypothetical protein
MGDFNQNLSKSSLVLQDIGCVMDNKTNQDKFKKAFISKSKAQKALVALYAILFLLVLIMTGTVIQEGSSKNKNVSWALFVFSLIIGVLASVVMVKAKRNRKIYIPILSILIVIMNMTAMVMSQPKISTRELVTPHFANIVFGIVAVVSAIYSS